MGHNIRSHFKRAGLGGIGGAGIGGGGMWEEEAHEEEDFDRRHYRKKGRKKRLLPIKLSSHNFVDSLFGIMSIPASIAQHLLCRPSIKFASSHCDGGGKNYQE